MDFALPILPPPTSPESTHLSSTTHRRIDLQSPADLAHLHHTASRAAAAKLDRDVPRNGNGEEEGKGANSLRSAVEEEVAAYIDRIFEGAGKNVFVNGVEAEAVEWRREGMEEFEPYDARLAAKMSALHATIENLNLELANTRRSAAKVAGREFERGWEEQSRVAEGVLDEGAESAKRDGEGSRLLGEGGLGFEGRAGEVQRTWERGMEGLVRLKAGLGETMRRAEEAKRTVEYLEGRS